MVYGLEGFGGFEGVRNPLKPRPPTASRTRERDTYTLNPTPRTNVFASRGGCEMEGMIVHQLMKILGVRKELNELNGLAFRDLGS